MLTRRTPGSAALRRPPHLLRQGDRRRRKRERRSGRARFTVDTTGPVGDDLLRSRRRARPRPTRAPRSASPPNEPGASFSCQLDAGGFAPCISPYTASSLAGRPAHLPGQGDGRAGNTGSAPVTWTRSSLCDHLGPQPRARPPTTPPRGSPSPPRTRAASAAGSTASSSPPLHLAVHEPGALGRRPHVRVEQRIADSGLARTSPSTPPPGGDDVSGPADGAVTNDPTPSFRFSSTESRPSFQCRDEGRGFSACSGARSDTAARGPLRRDPTFFVRAIDAAGNKSDCVLTVFTVDTVPPKVTIKGSDRAIASTAEGGGGRPSS